jgi:hypothetical protein
MASALSHRMGTGIGVADLGSRSPKKGSFGPSTAPDWRFTAGRKGHSMRVPKGCVEVVISDAMQKRAEGAIENWGKGAKLREATDPALGLPDPERVQQTNVSEIAVLDFPIRAPHRPASNQLTTEPASARGSLRYKRRSMLQARLRPHNRSFPHPHRNPRCLHLHVNPGRRRLVRQRQRLPPPPLTLKCSLPCEPAFCTCMDRIRSSNLSN